MGRHSVATVLSEFDFGIGVLDEDRVRDQLSAAEELAYVGHREPALVAAGAALEGTIRLRASAVAGEGASAGALLEALLSIGALAAAEYDLLYDALAARDRLIHGFTPARFDAADPERIAAVLEIAIRLLECPRVSDPRAAGS
jgi:hypothetical protein